MEDAESSMLRNCLGVFGLFAWFIGLLPLVDPRLDRRHVAGTRA